MRAARLISLVLLLQNRGVLTGPQLAAELGVSERTIARDVAELGEAGVPVYAQQGRAGGYRLLDGYRTRLTGLDRTEVEALFLSGAPDALHAFGLDEVALAARLKVGAAIAPSAREAPERVQRRFHLDAPGWFRDAPVPDCLRELSRAVWHDRRVSVTYLRGRRLTEDSDPAPVTRVLDPYGLVLKAGVWYMVANAGSGFRSYRVDRFQTVEVSDTGFDRDPGFSLAQYWQDSSAAFMTGMLSEPVRVRISPDGMRQLPLLLSEPAASLTRESAGPPDAHGWVEAVIPSESLDVAYLELLRFGPEAEVMEPPTLRERLAEAAERTAQRYRDAGRA